MAFIKGYEFKNTSTSTGAFEIKAGKWAVMVNATFGGGSITLQKLSSDGSTYVTALTAFTAAGFATADLPDGKYRFTVATATAVYAEIKPIFLVEG